eukprot:188289_1
MGWFGIPSIPFPEYNLAQHICALFFYILSFIITLLVFICECRKRLQISKNNELKGLNTTINNNSLNIHSIFALFSCVMHSFTEISIKIPVICPWPMYAISVTWWLFIQFFLTFYQIARLKYCFSSKNSLKYGYSNKLFISLNICGVMIFVYGAWMNFDPRFAIFSSKPRGNLGCKYFATKFYNKLTPSYSALFYIWDWTVLLLYVIKIIQFQRKKSALKTAMNEIVYKKVKFILQKIVLLTIIYEITGAIAIGVHGLFESNFIWAIATSLDVIFSSFILYLMVEHNNDYYLYLINLLNSWRLCCCCKSLIDEVLDHEKQDKPDTPNNVDNHNHDTICETRDITPGPKPLSMMESELTMSNMKSKT